MKTKLPFVLFVALVLASGCASAGKQVWYQPGKTPAQTYTDLNAAKAEARASLDPHGVAGFMPLMGRPNTGGYVKDAMRAKGYVPTPASQITNASQYPKP